MWARFALILAVFGSAVLGGCSSIRSTITTYQAEPPISLAGALIAIEPSPALGEYDVLEFQYLRRQLALALRAQGILFESDVAAERAVQYRLELDYSVNRQEKNQAQSSARVHGSAVYGGRYGSVVASDDYNRPEYEFERRFKFIVFSEYSLGSTQQNRVPLLSVSAVSYGQCEHLASIADAIFSAMVQQLNNPSGAVSSVNVKASRPCAE